MRLLLVHLTYRSEKGSFMKSIFLGAAMIASVAMIGFAQPRPIERSSQPAQTRKSQAPASFEAKYEGGMFGFSQKETGQLKFDDMNERLVFFGENGKEKFSIPYDALLVVYPQSKSVTTTTGNVVSHIPLPGAGLAGFIKEKRRYLIMQIQDPDADVKGVVNFKLENKELLDSVMAAIAEKAKLEPRGDAYYKPKPAKST
jgi:hypothetical protein